MQKTSRLKLNPPLGAMPALQYAPPSHLAVDRSYQRSLEASASQSLIRKIAQYWNWDLCQPLVVSRREGGSLFVIDGQHRLEAARLRGDIQQLPCVIVSYADVADEAASFVNLNQQRRALSKLDLFKAALASEDKEAREIVDAMTDAGLSIAPHSNHLFWKPGMVSNIGGIERAWRQLGGGRCRCGISHAGARLRRSGAAIRRHNLPWHCRDCCNRVERVLADAMPRLARRCFCRHDGRMARRRNARRVAPQDRGRACRQPEFEACQRRGAAFHNRMAGLYRSGDG